MINTNNQNISPLIDIVKTRNCSVIRNNGVSISATGLHSDVNDSWIELSFDHPTTVISFDIRFPEGYFGDIFTLYFLTENMDYYSENNTYRVNTNKSSIFTRVIESSEIIKSIRIDISETCGDTGVKQIKIGGFASIIDAYDFLFYPIDNCGSKLNNVIICTHELGSTGAPLLALNIAKEIIKHSYNPILLSVYQNGIEVSDYCRLENIPLFELRSYDNPSGDYHCLEEGITTPLRYLRKKCIPTAYLNTVVSGQFSKEFSIAGFKTVSLIHETIETLEVFQSIDLAKKALLYSDNIIFPSESILNSYKRQIEYIPGSTYVRPQGMYITNESSDSSRITNGSSLRKKLNIDPNAKIVAGSGSANLRKGIDLFILAANECIASNQNNLDIHFVWFGNYDNNEPLKMYLQYQVSKSVLLNNFHILPFVEQKEYKALLSECDIFWCTSRDDTFPSVVLEAMLLGKPVCAFSNTGGVDYMLDKDRGVLIEGFLISDFASRTIELIFDSQKYQSISAKAMSWVKKKFSFTEYIDYLLDFV